MEGFAKEYYKKTIQTDINDLHWTQFELDLIRCIREQYPIVYAKAEDLTGHQRAVKVRSAWKEIGKNFNELPMNYIKATWRRLLKNYLKVKIYTGSTSRSNDDLVKNKFMDGTLSFLENEADLQFGDPIVKYSSTSHHTDEKESDDENTEGNSNSYEINIKKLLHEEIDLDVDEIIKVKEEVADTNEEDSVKANNKNSCVDDKESEDKPKKIWSEDELMNATHLTKEMIDQLILIKNRHYYMAPVAPGN